ncbi:hypothetical protein FBUS_07744 [Fasciolopsis buskii]|uniref:Uncharacterized protein n=1 Tax=Fasciolopsis buskii TaxID=27845 RepID=A0A8E0VG02_9TREM|nr:hypothetical protein FBUS_07744 [Fasciolopsis buski]
MNYGILQDRIPTLQNAEPIAVATPDKEDHDLFFMFGSDDPCPSSLIPLPSSDSTSVNPKLPVPPGLKVFAVDNRDVHILEDGSFSTQFPVCPVDRVLQGIRISSAQDQQVIV